MNLKLIEIVQKVKGVYGVFKPMYFIISSYLVSIITTTKI